MNLEVKNCNKHTKNEIYLYCKDCNAALCKSCQLIHSNHNTEPYITYVRNKTKKALKKSLSHIYKLQFRGKYIKQMDTMVLEQRELMKSDSSLSSIITNNYLFSTNNQIKNLGEINQKSKKIFKLWQNQISGVKARVNKRKKELSGLLEGIKTGNYESIKYGNDCELIDQIAQVGKIKQKIEILQDKLELEEPRNAVKRRKCQEYIEGLDGGKQNMEKFQ